MPETSAGLCPACLLLQSTQHDREQGQLKGAPLPLEEVAALFPQLQIIGLLGAGGMGAVYKARQPALDRLVALKVLPLQKVSGPSFAERFNREARALARLSHPNIVAVYEFGQAGGLPYFIMEFVDGTNLRQLERAGQLSARDASQIIPQICDALQYAHEQGVVHRDIKPENVLVDRRGRVKIADFGLAKILDRSPESLRLTSEGQVMGTPHYMAPEQVERPLTVDHRADIYSVGVVLYEMLTGDLPLGNFAPPSSKKQVDSRFDKIVLRALENDPAHRYQHASELKSSVESIALTPPPPAAEPNPPRAIDWAGFPIVMERDGRRGMHWKGAAKALAMMFLLISLVALIPTLTTGHPSKRWLGVIGWQSVLVRLGIAGLILALGIRRAFLQPRTITIEQAQENSRRWKRRWRVIFMIPIVVVAWIGFQNGWLIPPATSWLQSLSHRPQVAVINDKSGALVAELPSGGLVEMLAVCDSGAAPNEWWLPDGTPIPDILYEILQVTPASFPARTNKDIIVRWRDLPKGASGPNLEFEPGAGFSAGGAVLRNGERFGGWPVRAAFPRSAAKTRMRMGFGIEPWKTISSHDPKGNNSTFQNIRGFPDLAARVHQIGENAGQAQVTILMGKENRNWTLRVIAMDTNGIEHISSRNSGTPVERSSVWTYQFLGLPLDAVKQFLVQVRPIHWIEFRSVVLQPRGRSLLGRSARPLKPTSFGAAKEVEITGWFDLDTGNTAEFQNSPDSSNSDLVRKDPAWARAQGFDLQAAPNQLRLLELEVVDLSGNEWDTFTTADLTDRLNRMVYAPPTLPPGPIPKLPLTYGFRTHEGAFGMFQFLRLDSQRTNSTLRYRLIERAHFE